MSALTFGELTVNPGERVQGNLGRFYMSDGTEVKIPLMALRGTQDGPALWLGAAMHGQELSGIPVIWQIIKDLVDPAALRGTVVGAPILNPFSFNGRTYFTPEDGYNVNRVFPGDPNGLLTHRLANLIFEEGAKKCDYLIDFHCNMSTAMYFSIIKGTPGDEAFEKSKKMADAFGITTIEMILKHEAHRTGTLGDEAGKIGKPDLTIELIPWRVIDPEAVEVGVRGVLNVMKVLDMIDGDVEAQTIEVISERLSRTELNATRGGLVSKLVEVGEAITKDQLIGHIVNAYGEPIEDIISPVDGWLLAWPMINNQSAGTGEHVAFLAFKI